MPVSCVKKLIAICSLWFKHKSCSNKTGGIDWDFRDTGTKMRGLNWGQILYVRIYRNHCKQDYLIYLFSDANKFTMRAFLFQARNLIGCDDSGLSDPFARVIICEKCQKTTVIEETLSPVWDTTLTFNDVTLHLPLDQIKMESPMVIVEIFDWDTVVGSLTNQF